MKWKANQEARISLSGFAMYLFAVPWTLFSLMWTGFAAAGVGSTEIDGAAGVLAWAFPLFGVPFVLIGFGLLAAPFLPLWERGKVLYAVTNQRVLKLRLGRTLNTTSTPLSRIAKIERVESKDGSGSLKLSIGSHKDSDGDIVTDHFAIGPVPDAFGAQRLITQLTEPDAALI